MSRQFVILAGGPPGTPRVWPAPPERDQGRVKVPRGNGYEHFEFDGEHIEFDGQEAPVYRWCYRTFIAE